MTMRSDIAGYLAGCENRMKFINIVRCLIDYPYSDDLKKIIPDHKIMDNIVLAVLVYIKERSLGEDQKCRLTDIAGFLEEILPSFHVDNENAEFLARYITVAILQNGGQIQEFKTYDSKKNDYVMQQIRLLSENEGSYRLTDEAFDFLFRTKEIESELDYSVTRFRLSEYMKRHNYTEALSQSRELIQRIRSMKTSMEDFLLRCRENIARIDMDRYNHLITDFRNLMNEEDKQLNDIQKDAKKEEKRLLEAEQNRVDAKNLLRNQKALAEIVRNIDITISEQRSLINKRSSFSDSYEQLIHDSFTTGRFESLDFEKDVMVPLRNTDGVLGDAALHFLYPLLKPVFPNFFSIENFYAPQGSLNQEEEPEEFSEEDYENLTAQVQESRNQRYQGIVTSFFTYIRDHKHFTIQDYINDLKVSQLNDYCKESALPNVILTFYGLQTIDIQEWKREDIPDIKPLGEFELSWCLKNLPEDLLDMKCISFERSDQTFRYEYDNNGEKTTIEMNDFTVEVTL